MASAPQDPGRALFERSREIVFRRTDRMFAWLMLGQWTAAILVALFVSPYAWSGKERAAHAYVCAAVLLGAAIGGGPVVLALKRPGWLGTRAAMAIAQMLWSAMFIHLTGGRIETHFHVFGSLAALALYRDWRVLAAATMVVAADHLVRGVYWPESVYGVANPSWWRFAEHAFWVALAGAFLVASCLQGVREMRALLVESTERERQTREKLMQADKLAALGQLSGGVAHEINNPLGVILGFAQGLERRVPEGDSLRAPVTSIVREALRCKNLVQEFLALSRTAKRAVETVDLNALVRSSLVLLEARAKTRSVDIVDGLCAQPLPVLGNATHLQQVVVNLGNNALDAMKGGGTLTVRTARSDDRVMLEVADTGAGMTDEVRAHIFEPFFTTKDAGEGTGLGLSLVLDIVQQHHGTIEARSEPARGTVMTVRLPVRQPALCGRRT